MLPSKTYQPRAAFPLPPATADGSAAASVPAARTAVAESRLVELSDGRIGYSLKKRRRDGTTAVVMTKAVLMERLCALVPARGSTW